MKRVLISGVMAVAMAFGLLSFHGWEQSAISGKVVPAEGAEKVWALSATDTLQADIREGIFTLPVPAGNYTVTIDAREPYKDVRVENVNVSEGHPADLGEIRLQE